MTGLFDFDDDDDEAVDPKLYGEFQRFHRENPQVYRYICRFANQAIKRGYREFAIGIIWERMRWEVLMETTDNEFKLSNNHRAYYARLWLRDHPAYPDFFKTRMLRSANRDVPVDRYGRER